MKQGQIDKVVDEYIGYPHEIDEGIDVSMRRDAFRDGAKWRIGSVWHDASEKPQTGKPILFQYKKRNEVSYEVHTLANNALCPYMYTQRWAYVSDLLPDTPPQT